jgi:hypothetical protein
LFSGRFDCLNDAARVKRYAPHDNSRFGLPPDNEGGEFGIIFAKQFSGREIIEAKFPEPGGVSIWSAAG